MSFIIYDLPYNFHSDGPTTIYAIRSSYAVTNPPDYEVMYSLLFFVGSQIVDKYTACLLASSRFQLQVNYFGQSEQTQRNE